MSVGATTAVFAVLIVAGLFAAVAIPFHRTRRYAAEAERQVPPVGRFVDVRGHALHYVEAGQGKPIVFIHGLGGQLHHFRHPLFSRLENDFRLVAVDRPGAGYSTRGGPNARLSEHAATLAAFIHTLGLERPLVVGHSLGGAIALGLALDHPEALSGLALIAPLSHLHDSLPPEFAPLYIRSGFQRWLIARTTAVPMAVQRAPETLDFVFGPQAAPDDYIVAGGGMLGLRPSHMEGTMADLTAIEQDLGRYEARYQEITVPVGILFGSADRVLDPRIHGEALRHRLRDASYTAMDGIGHMVQFVAPGETEIFIRVTAARAFDAVRAPAP